jgi:hypothetical protein
MTLREAVIELVRHHMKCVIPEGHQSQIVIPKGHPAPLVIIFVSNKKK